MLGGSNAHRKAATAPCSRCIRADYPLHPCAAVMHWPYTAHTGHLLHAQAGQAIHCTRALL
eukprot:1155601-Pelagomonas_calceolata.AAC.2